MEDLENTIEFVKAMNIFYDDTLTEDEILKISFLVNKALTKE